MMQRAAGKMSDEGWTSHGSTHGARTEHYGEARRGAVARFSSAPFMQPVSSSAADVYELSFSSACDFVAMAQ